MHFKLNFRRQKETDPKQIRHSSNGFYLSFMKENTLSHKPRCSWTDLILLCPELISYFISKWDIKKACLEVLHSQVLWNKTTIFTRPGSYSCWKTWSCISSFLLTTRIESWITKKKKKKIISQSFPVKFCSRPTSPGKSSELSHLILP